MTFSTGAGRTAAYKGKRRSCVDSRGAGRHSESRSLAAPPKGEAAMKACFRTCLAAVAAAVLAACATTSDYEPRLTPSSEIQIRDNEQYISAVEKAARKRGVGVIWVNPPQVRIED
jgi:hypothetical protein